jgi:methyltransferase-like protein/cyclopropane fatty-acyl-phospholipid synthase-like methyltransferase
VGERSAGEREAALGAGDDAPTSYDVVPYASHPYPLSQPDRLRTIAWLFGLEPAPVTRCRVLELGCAAGGNIIPLACRCPESEFVGVELSGVQAEAGRRDIDALGLANIRIEHASITDIDQSWGLFDYIICHGVYSWVPEPVRAHILRVAKRNLAPTGVAYVSYNTYPGWHMRDSIRHMMRYHVAQFDEPAQRVEQARALIDFLAENALSKEDAYGKLLQQELKMLQTVRDDYIYHDHLEDNNTPCYFHQFAERAEGEGLQYLGESEFHTMLAANLPDEAAATLDRVSAGTVSTEQYMDFLRNRMFRSTLLCHVEVELHRHVTADRVTALRAACRATPADAPVDLAEGVSQAFDHGNGARTTTTNRLTKAALELLGARWPQAVPFAELRDAVEVRLGEPGAAGEGGHALAIELLHLYAHAALELNTWQAPFVTTPSEKPRVCPWVLMQSRRGTRVTNQRHESVELDTVTAHLAPLLDGETDRAAMLACFLELLEREEIKLEKEGSHVRGEVAARAALVAAIEQGLERLGRCALLVA